MNIEKNMMNYFENNQYIIDNLNNFFYLNKSKHMTSIFCFKKTNFNTQTFIYEQVLYNLHISWLRITILLLCKC